jgi:hypothetical protein
MKQLLTALVCIVICCSTFGQRKTTTVKSYFRKDGTFVCSHTRHYNAGSGSITNGYAYSSSNYDSENSEVFESALKVHSTGSTGRYKKAGQLKIIPSHLMADTSGVTVLVAVLRYNDTVVVDICPLPRSILTYDYDMSSTSLYFKIPKDKIKPEHIIELASKYQFDLKDDYLTKSEYLGIGKIDLPKYMNLKIEAITLK